MSKLSNILIVFILVLPAINLNAQQSSSAHISANIISAVGSEKQGDLNFGEFYLPKNSAQVTISSASERSIVGKLETSSSIDVAEAATLKVLAKQFDFGVTVQKAPIIQTRFSNRSLIIDNFIVDRKTSDKFENLQLISIGARLSISEKIFGDVSDANVFSVAVHFN